MEYFLIGNNNDEAALSPGALGGQFGDPTEDTDITTLTSHSMQQTDHKSVL